VKKRLPKEDAMDKEMAAVLADPTKFLAVLAKPTPIAELLPQVPLRLRHLRLPLVCTVETTVPMNPLMTGWNNATWSEIQAQCRILTEQRAWGLLDAVQQLSCAVEPLMREDPARTLTDAMTLLSLDEETNAFRA
jgi:hypothetical protein